MKEGFRVDRESKLGVSFSFYKDVGFVGFRLDSRQIHDAHLVSQYFYIHEVMITARSADVG